MDLADELKNIVDQVTVSRLPTINWFTSSMMLYVTGDNPEQLQAYHDGMRTECYQMRELMGDARAGVRRLIQMKGEQDNPLKLVFFVNAKMMFGVVDCGHAPKSLKLGGGKTRRMLYSPQLVQ